MVDINDQRPATLLYGERSTEDIAYKSIFEEAHAKIGLTTKYVISTASKTQDSEIVGNISRELIEHEIPDYTSRIFYISGPQSMVQGVRRELRAMGVPKRNIKADYFFGYA